MMENIKMYISLDTAEKILKDKKQKYKELGREISDLEYFIKSKLTPHEYYKFIKNL